MGSEKKVAIVELNYHEEYLRTIAQLVQKADIFTVPKIAENVRELYDEMDDINFIYNFTQEDIAEYDYIFFNTIRPTMLDMNYWKSFKREKGKYVFLTIHNLNAWGERGFKLRKNVVHSIDSMVVSNYLKRFAQAVDKIIVVSETLVPKAKEFFPLKNVVSLPFALAMKKSYKEPSLDEFTFVIPGTYETFRRDYKTVFQAFDELYQEDYQFELVLLGKCKKTKELMEKRPYLVAFENRVPEKTYYEYLNKANFIICPSMKSTHSLNTRTEYYSYTKSFNQDYIKARKPLIIPDYLAVPENLSSATLKYSDNVDLFCKLKDLMNVKSKRWYEKAFELTEEYTLPKVTQYFNTNVLEVEKNQD